MKKLLLIITACAAVMSCNQADEPVSPDAVADNINATLQRNCPSETLREEALKNNPSLMERYMTLENNTKEFIKNKSLGKVLADGTLEIPVIVNVLYNSSVENISDAQIQSQIEILNKDYSATNSDIAKIPSEFQSSAAGNTGIKFRLAKINRKSTTVRRWKTNDAMKKTSRKGLDATDPAHYLNIWIIGNMGGVLGYATFPESAGLWNDGVVIAGKYFGATNKTPYNLGRTATHEVGHYLNLRHIWGDGTCATDYVDDTPTQADKNFGKPTYPQIDICGGVSRSVMFMNYMDYVDDAAMFMFSAGQKSRIQAVTNASGLRSSLRL